MNYKISPNAKMLCCTLSILLNISACGSFTVGGMNYVGSEDASAGTSNSSVDGSSHGSSSSSVTSLGDTVPTAVDLLSKSSSYTTSSTCPLGTKYVNASKIVLTDEQKSFLSDPNQNVASVDGFSIYNQVTVKLYPSSDGEPSPADARQHSIGDCDGVAALVGLAYVHPEFVKSIIQDNNDGTFDIAMFAPDGSNLSVGVNSQFLVTSAGGKSLRGAGGTNDAVTWASVLEKAVMKYNSVYKIVNNGTGLGGIGSEHTLPMFTGDGESYAFSRGILNPNDLYREIRYALANGMIVTGGFGIASYVDGYKSVTGHAYTVLSPEDANTMISMRNPWGFASTDPNGGKTQGAQDGVLNIVFDPNWSGTIDLRVISGGIAGRNGTVTPYTVKASKLATESEIAVAKQWLAQDPNNGF